MYDISVVIPTYNRENTIRKSIDSVISQKGQGDLFNIREIIIVDDGSTDDTESVVSAVEDERILFYRMDVNSGAAAARNKGVEQSHSDWIAFQDSDDMWHTDKLDKQVRFLAGHPDAEMAAHPIKAFFDDGSVVVTNVPDGSDIVSSIADDNTIGTPTILVKKSAFLECGGFDDSFRALEDWDFVLRFSDKHKIGVVDEPLIDVDMVLSGISSDVTKYYEYRCRLIAKNREMLMNRGCFNRATESLLKHAEGNGILPQIGKMLELYLTNTMC